MRTTLRLLWLTLLCASTCGSLCEEERPYAPCDGVTCSGRGQCVLDGSTPTCECDEGYEPWGLSCAPEGSRSEAGPDGGG